MSKPNLRTPQGRAELRHALKQSATLGMVNDWAYVTLPDALDALDEWTLSRMEPQLPLCGFTSGAS